MPSRIDAATLQMALIGYQAEHSRIEEKIAEIRRRLGGTVSHVAGTKRVLSVAARKRIAAAQKKRWAQFHKGKKVAAVAEPPKAKRRISAEGLKRIIAATKRRWAAKRAAEAKPEPAHVKKAATKKTARRKAAVKAPVKAAKKAAPPMTETPPDAPAQ